MYGYDPILKEFLVNGFRYGFRIQFVGENLLILKVLWFSQTLLVSSYARKCDAGRIVGPYSSPPFPLFSIRYCS